MNAKLEVRFGAGLLDGNCPAVRKMPALFYFLGNHSYLHPRHAELIDEAGGLKVVDSGNVKMLSECSI